MIYEVGVFSIEKHSDKNIQSAINSKSIFISKKQDLENSFLGFNDLVKM